jgi:DNA polymerase III delta subunit
MSRWSNPPPVVVLSGTDDYLRSRELRAAVSAADEAGRGVEYLQGGNNDDLRRVLSSTGVLFREEVLVVVDAPEEVDAALVLEHHATENNTTVIVLHHEGAIKAKSNLAQIADALPSRFVARFEKPKPWEEIEYAARFCVSEASTKGVRLSLDLAERVVRTVGTDLGILAFEIDKVARLMRAEGGDDVTMAHMKRTIGAFSEMGPKPIVEALERRDIREVGSALASMRRTHAGQLSGGTLRACAFIGTAARSWLHVASLLEEGLSQDEISDRIKLAPFVVRKTSIPTARRWGKGDLISLLKSIAAVERGVRNGHANSWVALECALFRSLRTTTSG